jgi:hypothetical protein
MALPDCLQHIFYENEIPPEVGLNLEIIYQSPFCATRYIEIFRGIRNFNALVISCGESDPRHVIAYTISGKEITVLNELIEIEQEYIQYFAETVFSRYPTITTVNFNCLKRRIVNFRYPWRLWQTSHDIAIELPRSFEEYHSKLGRQTQKHIRYYINRLHRDYADFAFHVAAVHEIDPTVIGRIIEMNQLRMKDKNIRSGYNNLFEKKIIEFCRHYGLISTVSVQGKIVAGTICYEVGNQAYLEAISHDPGYDKYNVGQVCLYLTVKHMIEQERDFFHMLWGENEYKYRFLGLKQDLFYFSIYRSTSSKLLSVPKLAKHMCSNIFNQLEYLTRKYFINRFKPRR